MKKITEITNREEIVERIAELLMQFDKNLNGYSTDVYLYIDEETGTATLDTFVNVGGNSWRNDDGIVIYTDKEHFDSMYDYYCNDGEFADALCMEHAELQKETLRYFIDEGETEDYKPDWHEIREYIETREDYVEKLTECYYDYIESIRSDYIKRAEEIVRYAEEHAFEEES